MEFYQGPHPWEAPGPPSLLKVLLSILVPLLHLLALEGALRRKLAKRSKLSPMGFPLLTELGPVILDWLLFSLILSNMLLKYIILSRFSGHPQLENGFELPSQWLPERAPCQPSHLQEARSERWWEGDVPPSWVAHICWTFLDGPHNTPACTSLARISPRATPGFEEG